MAASKADPQTRDPRRVVIFDTTLRDAEQTPGASLTVRDKLEIAQQLARLNVDVIEAGFPISSNEDFEAVHRIGIEVEGPTICGLSRAVLKDIDRAGEALKDAARPRIHTFVGTSPEHLEGQMRKSGGQVLEMAVQAVAHAKGYVDDVEFSPMDAGRTEFGYLAEVVQATIEAGATTINIPDTVGFSVPEQFGALIRRLLDEVPDAGKAIISVHCHDDLGMAVSNTLAALRAGARQVECTLNGIGERAGNASMEELVMALRTRGDRLPYRTGIASEHLYPSSRMVSLITGLPVQPNKAVVGANAFAHEAGIHQDGVLKEKSTYEIMTPESVGVPTNELVLGKHSGRHAFRERVKTLGYELDDERLESAFEAFKALADKKKTVYDEDIDALIAEKVLRLPDRYRLVYLNVNSGTVTVPTATVQMEIDGVVRQEAGFGDGPVDAAFSVVKKLTGRSPRLMNFAINAITGGTDAQAEVSVRLEEEGALANGQASDTDIVVASTKAFVRALNKVAHRQLKSFTAHL